MTSAASYPLVRVRWTDACSWDEWRDVDAPWAPVEAETTGFVVADEGGYLAVAPTISKANDGSLQVAGVMSIPRGCIHEVERVMSDG